MTGEPAAAHRPRVASPWSVRHSLRVRLPFLSAAIIAVVVSAIVWAASREVEMTLIRAAGDRATGAAGQVSSLFERSTVATLDNLRRIAADIEIRRFVANPTDAGREVARARVAPLATGGPRRIELWSAAGAQLLAISIPDAPSAGASLRVLPAIAPPGAAGLSALQTTDNMAFSDSIAEIRAEPPPADLRASSILIGYLVSRSSFSVNPPGALSRLVGDDAVIAIGNTAGETWTNLSRVVPKPPVDVTQNGVSEYVAADGQEQVGAVSAVRGSPWAVWVGFPRSIIVAPARVFFERMAFAALIFVIVSAIIVARLSVRITRPLHELAEAAAEIAGGDYGRRVSAARPDEIGALGRAFNAMTADVELTHQQLQARVHDHGLALEALGQSEAHYRAIIEQAFDCIITIDATGKVVEFNPAAEETFGYRKANVLGLEIADLIVPPASRDAHRRGLARYIATGESRIIGQLVELTAMRSDGAEFPIELAISVVSSDPPLLTAVARNITERKRAEDVRRRHQAMEEQSRRAVEANRLKSEFVANMSHELRTPLNAIIGFADLMHTGRAGAVSPEHQEYLGDILTSSRHLLQLINDVLDLAKVESGKMEFRAEPVDLSKLVYEVHYMLRGLAAQKQIQIEAATDPGLASVIVDPVRVKQILYNYLSNAIKFTDPGGRIQIRATAEDARMFRLEVEDTGVGVTEDDVGKLFAEFQQLDGSVRKEQQGTGLGLALTKKLAEALGGHVLVRSVARSGSTFSAILPRVMSPTSDDTAPPVDLATLPEPGRGAEGSTAPRTVLLIDDVVDELNRLTESSE